MSKKIAIVIDQLSYGGVVKVFEDYLQAIHHEFESITIYLRDTNDISIAIPSNADIVKWPSEIGVAESENPEKWNIIRNKILYYLSFRNFGRRIIYKARCRRRVAEKYDYVVGYHMVANDVSVMTLEKVNAGKRILYLHCKKRFAEKDVTFYDRFYARTDAIVCVSQETKEVFDSLMPVSRCKTQVIHNFFNANSITERSYEPIDDLMKKTGEIVIVTVANLLKVKGLERIIEVTKKLIENGYPIRWYIIGKGDLYDTLQKTIEEYKLEEKMILLGYRDNPYPYIRQCDIYVQSSYSEGYCTATMEAKILHKPVVTTDVPGMREQFTDDVNGLIVESSVDGLYKGIKRLIDDPELRIRIVSNLTQEMQQEDINRDASEKTFRLFGMDITKSKLADD